MAMDGNKMVSKGLGTLLSLAFVLSLSLTTISAVVVSMGSTCCCPKEVHSTEIETPKCKCCVTSSVCTIEHEPALTLNNIRSLMAPTAVLEALSLATDPALYHKVSIERLRTRGPPDLILVRSVILIV